MTCAEHQRRLSAYVDAQLPAVEREALDVHLAACAGCREALTTLQTMLQSLKTLAVAQAPDMWPAVRAQLKAAPQAQAVPQAAPQPVHARGPWLHNWPLHGAALMMGAVLIAVVLGVPERVQPPRRLQTASLNAQTPAMSKTRVLAATHVQESEVSAYADYTRGGAEAKLARPTGPHVVQLEWPVTQTQVTIDHLAQWLPAIGGRISAQDENHLIVHLPGSQYAGLLDVLRQHLPATVNAADAPTAPVDLPTDHDLAVDLLLEQIE